MQFDNSESTTAQQSFQRWNSNRLTAGADRAGLHSRGKKINRLRAARRRVGLQRSSNTVSSFGHHILRGGLQGRTAGTTGQGRRATGS